MAEDQADQMGGNFDKFAQKYRLWLIIPLIIAAAIAFWNTSAAVGLLTFMFFVWSFVAIISLILWTTRKLLPKSISPNAKKEIQGAIGGTLFLGGCAAIGMVLRGENAISNIAVEKVPDGVKLGFIDPTFALVCIIFVWAYAAYRMIK